MKKVIENKTTIGMWLSILIGIISMKYSYLAFFGIILAMITLLLSFSVKDTTSYVVWRERAVLLIVVALCVIVLI